MDSSGLDNNFNFGDTVILVRKISKKEARNYNYRKLGFELETNGLFSHYYEKVTDDKVIKVGSPVFDSINTRICLNSRGWGWYKIIKEEEKLILIKE